MKNINNDLLDVEGAAAYLGVKKKTLDVWRCLGKGPKYVKFGRVFYRKADIDAWISSRVVDPEIIGGAA